MADGLFQDHAGAFGQADAVEVFADGPVHGGGCGEVGDQGLFGRDRFGQAPVTFALEEIQVQVGDAGHEAL